ncbi:hypothetical protein [Bacteroides caecigallinarum]|uniref:hypothetical protein n=1 Tax=Bacteroides caecigallinarum TaxID=1411144 RepID=UPI001F3B73A3|nr:hypothetical protein [Bacteroides caecigallinarum]MCF2738837.1 hypothetical protein [Bacteroides caecigallinarum]
MTWDDYSEKELVAILKSMIFVMATDNGLSDRAKNYLNRKAVLIDCTVPLLKKTTEISPLETVEIIRNMSFDKKDIIPYLWIESAAINHGRTYGEYCFDDFEYEKEAVLVLSERCNVDISNYLSNRHEIHPPLTL